MKSSNGEIFESNDIVNKALFDLHEYENNLLTTLSPIVIFACNNNRNIIVA